LSAAHAPDGRGRYFDGETASGREVALRFGAALEIRDGEQTLAEWRYAAIRMVDAAPAALRLKSLDAVELARLDVADRDSRARVEAACPNLGRTGLTAREVARIVFWSLLAAASVAFVAIDAAPRLADRIAPLVPEAMEARLGRTAATEVRAMFGGDGCREAKGVAALAGLARRLATAGELGRPVTVTVLRSGIPNAFALPGGRVYVLSALIDKAHDPDELGGVVAHELGHVAHRDGLRLMIADGGVAFLLSLLMGDVSGATPVIFMSRELVTSAHSREAEAQADAFAASALHRLGRPSAPLGAFLLRLTGEQSQSMMAYLASHPLTRDRLAALRADDAANDGPPLLDANAWAAVKAVCPGKPGGAD